MPEGLMLEGIRDGVSQGWGSELLLPARGLGRIMRSASVATMFSYILVTPDGLSWNIKLSHMPIKSSTAHPVLEVCQ